MVTSEVLATAGGHHVRLDRPSVHDGLGRCEADTLAREDERGRALIRSPDVGAGVAGFTA